MWFELIGCMILMKESISLTTAAMKMSKVHFYSDHRRKKKKMLLKEKNVLLGNSMLNHPGHVTLTLWIFIEGIIKICKS